MISNSSRMMERLAHWKSGLNALRVESAGLQEMITGFEAGMAKPFEQAVELMLRSRGRTIVSGMGKSGHIARKFAATLSSTGTPAQFVHPAEASHGDLGAITVNDILFVISKSGSSEELASVIQHASRFNIPLIAMTARSKSPLGKGASVILTLPEVEEACPNGLAPTTSTTIQLALCDALAVSLLSARKFAPADFKVYHPGGKLGASIRTVASLMHKGTELPLVQATALMREAILEMTGKGLGIVGITNAQGALAGAITDGDLRRHISDPDLLNKMAGDVMTHNPLTIAPDAWITEAARMFEAHNITSLFILDDAGKPAGLIRLADLLRLGIL